MSARDQYTPAQWGTIYRKTTERRNATLALLAARPELQNATRDDVARRTGNVIVRDHRYTPRQRWTATAVGYYDATDSTPDGAASDSRHHAYGGMSLAECEAWLTRRGIRRRVERPNRVTHSWHVRTDKTGDVTYRAVVLYWGKWDVARSWHVDSHHPRGLWAILCGRGVICRDAWQNSDAYMTWLMLGRVENVPTS